jgi:hypothetical protein
VVSDPPAPERGHVALHRHPLEAGHHRHAAVVQGLPQPVGPDLHDLGPGVDGVGDDAGLAAGVRGGVDAEVGQRHAQQGHRDALAGAEQHVDLAGRLDGADVGRQPDQLVGRLAHGADHDHDVVSGTPGAGHVVGHGPDAVGVGDRGSTELLHHERHGGQGYSEPCGGPGGGGRTRGMAVGARGMAVGDPVAWRWATTEAPSGTATLIPRGNREA